MFSSTDIIALTAILGGFLIIFVPVTALVTRKLVRDIVSTLGERRGQRDVDGVAYARRGDVDRLDQRIAEMEREVRGLREALNFDRQLRGVESRSES